MTKAQPIRLYSHEDNDVLLWDPVLPENLVGVAYVGLMPVVVPSVGASCKDNPQLASFRDGGNVAGLEGHAHGCRGQAESEEDGLHGVNEVNV